MATEKQFLKHFHRLKLNTTYNYAKTKKKPVMESIDIEICRILRLLNLPLSLNDLIINTQLNLWNALNPGIKCRNLQNLIPVAVYLSLKALNMAINETMLLKITAITKKEFGYLIEILIQKIIQF